MTPTPSLPFWQKVFHAFHKRTWQQEPIDYREYKGIRHAVYILRTGTGYERADLARRIGISPHTLNLLENRGGLMSQHHCRQCAIIAKEFGMPHLEEWFTFEAMESARKKRTRRIVGDTGQPDHFNGL